MYILEKYSIEHNNTTNKFYSGSSCLVDRIVKIIEKEPENIENINEGVMLGT